MDNKDKCPKCGSPQPHLHPAMQHEGEVQPCARVEQQVPAQYVPRAELDAAMAQAAVLIEALKDIEAVFRGSHAGDACAIRAAHALASAPERAKRMVVVVEAARRQQMDCTGPSQPCDSRSSTPCRGCALRAAFAALDVPAGEVKK